MLVVSLLLVMELINPLLGAFLSVALFVYGIFVSFTCIQSHFELPLLQAVKTEVLSLGKDMVKGGKLVARTSIDIARVGHGMALEFPGQVIATRDSLKQFASGKRVEAAELRGSLERYTSNRRASFDIAVLETRYGLEEAVQHAAMKRRASFESSSFWSLGNGDTVSLEAGTGVGAVVAAGAARPRRSNYLDNSRPRLPPEWDISTKRAGTQRARGTSVVSGVLDDLHVTNIKEKACANCLAPEGVHCESFLVCARCKVTYYCDRACQVAHWKAGHKKFCIAAKLAVPPK